MFDFEVIAIFCRFFVSNNKNKLIIGNLIREIYQFIDKQKFISLEHMLLEEP